MPNAAPLSAIDLPSLTSGFPGVAGVIVHDVDNGDEAAWNPDERFVAASLIKLPIAWRFYQECSHGHLDPNEMHTVTAAEMMPGFGVLRSLQPGLTLRLRDLAALMIVISDNTATNLLIDRLGIAAINATSQALGMTGAELQRKMYDYRDPAKNNFTTPRDMVRFFRAVALPEEVAQSVRLAPEYHAELLNSLLGQQCRNKLPSGLPRETRLAHKTGDMPQIEHDAGIFLGARRLIAVVMTKELTRNVDGVLLCRRVGELAHAAAS